MEVIDKPLRHLFDGVDVRLQRPVRPGLVLAIKRLRRSLESVAMLAGPIEPRPHVIAARGRSR
jgi:hypothetical protein